MKKFFISLILILFVQQLFSLEKPLLADSLSVNADSTELRDRNDVVAIDSAKIEKDSLNAIVFYTAKDSLVVYPQKKIGYLYGDAQIKYGDLDMSGYYMKVDMDSSIISSTFGLDSLGKETGYPTLKQQGDDERQMKRVRYNFKTRKAFIYNLITQEGEGYIVADQAKKNSDNSFFMKDAKYTTCDDHEHPHFYLNLSRAKVRAKKDVVTGPAWLVLEDVPLFPIVVPFAFFPFTSKYSSGIIPPTFGDEMTRGFYLQNGGYYFALSDYIDLSVTGNIYTKGSWGIGLRSNYRKRYKYSGGFNINFLKTVLGDKGLPDYSVTKDFSVSWTHAQDPKANMYRTISASVNFSTSSYNHNNLTSLYSREGANNTKSSSVSITQRFPESPWGLTATMNIDQVSRTKTVSANLPNLNLTMNRIFPFKRKKVVGAERWYEKISMSYSGQFRNSITTKEDKFFKSSLVNDWDNSFTHSIPVSATFSLFKVINVSPAINYNEQWNKRGAIQAWNPVTGRNEIVDTIRQFKRIYNYNVSLTADTKVYGMYVPWKMFGKKINTIRHVFSPSISLNYTPDFSNPKYGFYKRYNYVDQNGRLMEYKYNPYGGGVSDRATGGISFNFKNNIEMKLNTDNDSTKIVSLVDAFDVGFSYNMMADSMKWSPINTTLRLKLSKSYTLNLNATWNPYLYEVNADGRPYLVDKLRIGHGKGFGRLVSTGTSFSYSINQDSFKQWFGGRKDDNANGSDENAKANLPDDGTIGKNPNEEAQKRNLFDNSENNSLGEFDENGYLKNQINWNLSFNYTLNYRGDAGEFDLLRKEYKGKLTHNFGMSGSLQPTKNWNFTFNADYNFDFKRFTNINCSVTRQLHCWSMSASIIPIGQYKSYNFVIRANSSLLQDLKYQQSASPYDMNSSWY